MAGDAGRRAGSVPPAPPLQGRPRRRRAAVVAAGAAGALLVGATLPFGPLAPRASASIGSDRNRIRGIESLVNAEGTRIQRFEQASGRIEGRLLVVKHDLADEHRRLIRDRRRERGAAAHLRSVAVHAYVDAASTPSGLLLGSSSASVSAEKQVYSGVASGVLNQAITALAIARHDTSLTVSSLRSEKTTLTRALSTLNRYEHSAQVALTAEERTLGGLKGNLIRLITQANQRRQAARERAAEERVARLQAQARARRATATTDPGPPPTTPTPTTTPHRSDPPPPPPPPPPRTSGAYADPLRGISGLSPERIDQGVDYSGYGPIYAIGSGVVLCTVNGGWPGGTFIAYRLSTGPAAGLVVYAAEDIKPDVSTGEQVTSSTVLGQMYEGPSGIETGWADGSALGETMAASAGQFSGANSTAFGANFSQLLVSTGAPGGILQNNPPTGSLPAGWPRW